MKLISCILSFYILALTIVPCCLYDNCPDDKTEQTADHNKGDNDCGTCSPFFNCEGCASATIAFQSQSFEFAAFNSATEYAGYLLSPLTEVSPDYWQPPKLGSVQI